MGRGRAREITQKSLPDAFRADQQLRGLAPATIHIRLWWVGQFQQFLDSRQKGKGKTKDITMVNREDVKEYLANLRSNGIRQQTIGNYFTYMMAFFEFQQDEGIIQENPVMPNRRKYFKQYKVEKNSRHIISVRDAIMLVSSIMDTRDRTIVMLVQDWYPQEGASRARRGRYRF